MVATAAMALIGAACSGSGEDSDAGGGSDTPAPSSASSPTATEVAAPTDFTEPGPYAVGYETVTLTDPARDGRELTVDLWYPSDAEVEPDAERATYDFIPGIAAPSEQAVAGIAPSDDGPFPVVGYSHGNNGVRFISAFLTEQLASHGFVVAAADHAGNTAPRRGRRQHEHTSGV